MAPLLRLIRAAEASYWSRIAVIDGRRRLTFAEVARRSDRVAHVLHGVVGDSAANMALLVGNAAEAVELDVASVKAGVGRVSLNPRLTDDERGFIVAHSSARILVYDRTFADFAGLMHEQNPALTLLETGTGRPVGPGRSYEAELAAANPHPPAYRLDEDAASLIMYTSGTTGRPKGASWTLRSRTAAISNMLLNELDPAASVAMVHVASVSHGSGSKIIPIYLRGGASIMLPRYDPDQFLEVVAAERATCTFMAPTMVQTLADAARSGEDRHRSLVQVTYGGAKMPLPTIEAALATFGPRFAQVYGSSEAPHPVLFLGRHEHLRGTPVLASAGRPSIGVDVRIDDPAAPLQPGASGELLVSGPHLFAGYWDDPIATGEALVDGWFRTGDLATWRDDGYVEIVGRAKELIISGGYNVYPAEVERVLNEHPSISGSCVYGVPHSQWGEQVAAAVTVKAGTAVDVEALIGFCRVKLAGYKLPRQIRFVAELPLGPTGKVQRSVVANAHSAESVVWPPPDR
jgi:acyl-CoA synthetase (AMP-forming)/AMP-acid ligase II